jgi:hypothetical protein
MKLLTVRQPFASLIVASVGAKDIENRPVQTRLRGRIGIHSGRALHGLASEQVRADAEAGRLPLGAVIGTVQLVGCHLAGSPGCTPLECHQSVWAQFSRDGQKPIWHWELEGPRRFVTPIPARGQLGFWAPGPSLEHLMEIAEVEE